MPSAKKSGRKVSARQEEAEVEQLLQRSALVIPGPGWVTMLVMGLLVTAGSAYVAPLLNMDASKDAHLSLYSVVASAAVLVKSYAALSTSRLDMGLSKGELKLSSTTGDKAAFRGEKDWSAMASVNATYAAAFVVAVCYSTTSSFAEVVASGTAFLLSKYL